MHSSEVAVANNVESPLQVQRKKYFPASGSPEGNLSTSKLYSAARLVEQVAPSIFFPWKLHATKLVLVKSSNRVVTQSSFHGEDGITVLKFLSCTALISNA